MPSSQWACHKGVWQNGGLEIHTHTHTFNLCIWWMWLATFTPLPLYSHKIRLWCPMNKRLCGPPRRSVRSLTPPGIKPRILDCPVRNVITILTALYWSMDWSQGWKELTRPRVASAAGWHEAGVLTNQKANSVVFCVHNIMWCPSTSR